MIQQSDKTPPPIQSEEDVPLNSNGNSESRKEDSSLSKEKNARGPLEYKKFHLSSKTLGWCIFDAFRLIVMTILDYMFGSDAKS
ncbi:hypothetical protein [Pseudoflavonifractor sp. 524-17]|uniref:hypothetical protein n=1 Tax=Pseudoflavonifractor sp. 524-17 TaxID=2304577 RepID=UPI001379964C|nr:hypothetical protein [Pseudoflavonifractor sp. 524-17]